MRENRFCRPIYSGTVNARWDSHSRYSKLLKLRASASHRPRPPQRDNSPRAVSVDINSTCIPPSNEITPPNHLPPNHQTTTSPASDRDQHVILRWRDGCCARTCPLL